MPLLNLVVHVPAPPNGVGQHIGEDEEQLPEAAVMISFAMHLIESGASSVTMNPDGEHAKRFDIAAWLVSAGFDRTRTTKESKYAGDYRRGAVSVTVESKPGFGDVAADTSTGYVLAECKGGVINTMHAGQKSRLRRGLCEAVGQLMVRPRSEGRHIAVVPFHPETLRLARRMAGRAAEAGISIALVDRDGAVHYVAASE